MDKWRPDQSFYPSPRLAMQAEPEKLAYVTMLNPDPGKQDSLGVVDTDPVSGTYGQMIHRLEMPNAGRVAPLRLECLLTRASEHALSCG